MDRHLLRRLFLFLTLYILIIPNFSILSLDQSKNLFFDIVQQPHAGYNCLPAHQPIINTDSLTRTSIQKEVTRTDLNWLMHLYGPDHNSFTNATGPTNANILWYNTTGGTTYSSPCVANGMVFLGVGDSMKCYYKNNGTLAWTMNPDNNVAGGFGVCSSPAYANDCIYFGADKIYCVWAENGTIRWKVNKPNIKHGDGSPTLAEGKVFIAGSDYKLYCIDQLSGAINWTFQAKSDYPPTIPDNWGLYAAPAVENGNVYLAACDWYLYQINISQPTTMATANNTFKMNWASYSSPVVVGDKVYVGCGYMEKRTEARFYCLWASNLTKIWEFNPNTPSGFFSSAGYFNGQIFIGSIDGALYCLNASSGNQVWNYTLGSSIQYSGTWSSPAVTKDRFYIGTKSGYIYCFNTTQIGTPEYYWCYYLGGEVDTSPSVVPGRVFIGTHGNGGRIYCFGTPDNQPPQVAANYPEADATDVPSTVGINVTFNEPINPSTLTPKSFYVNDSSANSIVGTISYDQSTNTAAFKPKKALNRGVTYTVMLTSAVQDHWANTLDGNSNNISEGSPVDDYSWHFTISMNNLPELTKPNLTPDQGTTSTVFEFKVVYTDADNDSPEKDNGYMKILIDNEIIGRTMLLNKSAPLILRDGNFENGEEYIYSTTFSTYGLHKYRFTCSDGIDKVESMSYESPMVLAEPVIDPIGELDAYEDTDLILSLVDKVHDEDSNLADLLIAINSSYALIDDLNITFNYPNEFNYPSGNDHEVIAINVSDSVNTVTRDIKINVHAVNDPPMIKGVPDIQVRAGEPFYLNVSPYISDVDNEMYQIRLRVNSSYAFELDKNITFSYPKDTGILSEKVEINISDGELHSAQDILVSVIPEGAQFVILPIPDQNAVEDVELIVNITDYIKFVGNLTFEDLTLEVNSSHCSISRSYLIFNYPNAFNYPSGRDYELVQINVSSEAFNQVQVKTFKVNVLPVNDAPVITVIDAPTNALANSSISFKVNYKDIDGSEEPIIALVFQGKEYNLTISSGNIHSNGAVFKHELSLPEGEYEYYYWADDGEFQLNSIIKTRAYKLKVIAGSDIEIDSDGDNMPDAWELQYQLDPNDPKDAENDSDGDSYTNLEEYLGLDGAVGGNDSTDPRNPADHPNRDFYDKEKGEEESVDGMIIIWLLVTFTLVLIFVVLVVFILLRHKKQGSGFPSDYGSIQGSVHEVYDADDEHESELEEE